MQREILIKLIKDNSELYHEDDLRNYSDKQLQQIKDSLLLEVKSKLKIKKAISQYKKVIVIYSSQSCVACISFLPKLIEITKEEQYKNCHFLEIDAKENPHVEKIITSFQTPFVIRYDNGFISESKIIKSEGIFRLLLDFS